MADSFWYNGWQYFHQGRRCGREGCKCLAGELHGPYWYRRRKSSYREYVGRELDRRLLDAVGLRDSFRETLQYHIDVMEEQIALLQAVISGERELDTADRLRLESLGYPMLLPWRG